MKNILIVAAHADDEILGCGGTIAKHIDNGDKVSVLILCPDRISSAIEAEDLIGYTLYNAELNDQNFDTYSLLNIIKDIETMVKLVNPHIVYTHWIGDLNLDHEITARATLTACRPLPGSTIEAVYGFEIPSSTEWGTQPFMPNHFEEISEEQSHKKELALACYGSEIKQRPHARSLMAIHAMEVKRGAECGVNRAEAFYQYRRINKCQTL